MSGGLPAVPVVPATNNQAFVEFEAELQKKEVDILINKIGIALLIVASALAVAAAIVCAILLPPFGFIALIGAVAIPLILLLPVRSYCASKIEEAEQFQAEPFNQDLFFSPLIDFTAEQQLHLFNKYGHLCSTLNLSRLDGYDRFGVSFKTYQNWLYQKGFHYDKLNNDFTGHVEALKIDPKRIFSYWELTTIHDALDNINASLNSLENPQLDIFWKIGLNLVEGTPQYNQKQQEALDKKVRDHHLAIKQAQAKITWILTQPQQRPNHTITSQHLVQLIKACPNLKTIELHKDHVYYPSLMKASQESNAKVQQEKLDYVNNLWAMRFPGLPV